MFFSLALGLALGLSIDDEMISQQQAQVIDNLKKEIEVNDNKLNSLKKETDHMKTMLSKWENKGEKIKNALVGMEGTTSSRDDLSIILLGDQEFVNKNEGVLTTWDIQVVEKNIVEDSKKADIELEKTKSCDKTKVLIPGDNKELSAYCQENEIDYIPVEIDIEEEEFPILFEYGLIFEIIDFTENAKAKNR